MASSEERREVAQALRDANDTELYVMYLNEILAGILGVCPTDSYENVERKILDRLADLIDPTCHVVIPNEMDGECFCSECGALLGEYGYTAYCPCCGARCVDNGGRHAGDD